MSPKRNLFFWTVYQRTMLLNLVSTTKALYNQSQLDWIFGRSKSPLDTEHLQKLIISSLALCQHFLKV